MTLATERYRASTEADELWERYVRPLLAKYYGSGKDYRAFAVTNWRAALGVRVQGGYSDPLELVAEVSSYDQAMVTLMHCNMLRYLAGMKDIEEPGRPWVTPWRTGFCDAHNLTKEQGMRMLEEAKECVWRQMEQGCDGCHLPPGG